MPVALYCDAPYFINAEFVLPYNWWNIYHLHKKSQERKDHQLLLPELEMGLIIGFWMLPSTFTKKKGKILTENGGKKNGENSGPLLLLPTTRANTYICLEL